MEKSKKGFTLLELLIAATLIGVLAMFATQAFRASASDARIEDAKARALLLFSAAQRYYIEYPTAALFNFSDSDNVGKENKKMIFVDPAATNQGCTPRESLIQNLVSCGFLEYRQVAQETSTTGEEREVAGHADMWFEFPGGKVDNMKVCFQGKKGSRILDTCTYCTSGGKNFTKTCPKE